MKSGRRDPRALDYGRYVLVGRDDRDQAELLLADGRGLTLDEVEQALYGEPAVTLKVQGDYSVTTPTNPQAVMLPEEVKTAGQT